MTRDNEHSGVKQCLRLGLCPKPILLWCYQRFSVSLIGMMTIVASFDGNTPSSLAALLANWRFDPAANQLEVTLQDKTTPRYFLLAQPTRIVLDLPNTQLDKVVTEQNYSGAVRQVRVSQFEEDVARIVLELSPEVVLAPGLVKLERAQPQRGKGDRWLLRPLIASQAPDNPVTQSTGTPPSPTLPPATFSSQQPAVVTVPPLLMPSSVAPGESRSSTVISFGQPLPKATPTTAPPQSSLPRLQPSTLVLPEETSTNSRTGATSPLVVPTLTAGLSSQSPDILLPASTQLRLRYAGESALNFKAGSPQQAELLLEEDVRDRTGKVIAPAGTPVIGRFETDGSGSRFIAQAIALQNRNIPLAAQSDILDGNRTSSKPATLQPGQILQIRLTEALSKF